ncbi:hypothetical protein JDBV08_00665 [Mycobacterium phage jiawei]|uniref:hypothetical protein n=1 Tax=Brevundimonas diminuta TaxID=293 RepID=UPI0019035466|nr:hypothetical protein [Brevundimonas diminuta]MBK1968388.1 hypothetical protein [Brevundimonas diminuta]WRQ08300.1 hypothetical protein JDBV08_00665 [Mycobacterium phage jiawei]
MSAAMNALLGRAAREYQANEGVVSADTMMALAAEGYDLGDLEATMEAMTADD